MKVIIFSFSQQEDDPEPDSRELGDVTRNQPSHVAGLADRVTAIRRHAASRRGLRQ